MESRTHTKTKQTFKIYLKTNLPAQNPEHEAQFLKSGNYWILMPKVPSKQTKLKAKYPIVYSMDMTDYVNQTEKWRQRPGMKNPVQLIH